MPYSQQTEGHKQGKSRTLSSFGDKCQGTTGVWNGKKQKASASIAYVERPQPLPGPTSQ